MAAADSSIFTCERSTYLRRRVATLSTIDAGRMSQIPSLRSTSQSTACTRP
jgi:hypothetical protein